MQATADLRIGVPVVLDGDHGAVIAACETLSRDRLNGLVALPDGHLAITRRRADVLKAMVYDGDLARIALPGEVDLKWVSGVANPAADLTSPMKGPFRALRDDASGVSRNAIALCKAARLLPAALVFPLGDAHAFARNEGLRIVGDVEALTDIAGRLRQIAQAHVPLAAARASTVHVFADGMDEHYAIEIGRPDRSAPVLSRLHSACFTGDLMGSLKCDCGAQLRAALTQIAKDGSGVLLYLNQEGRGIGLANKLRAYALQDEGFDTVEANHRLGFEDDERDFRIGADILRRLGFSSARLMTNNPAKVARMEEMGLSVVERVPHNVGETPENAAYLATKAAKSGHLL